MWRPTAHRGHIHTCYRLTHLARPFGLIRRVGLPRPGLLLRILTCVCARVRGIVCVWWGCVCVCVFARARPRVSVRASERVCVCGYVCAGMCVRVCVCACHHPDAFTALNHPIFHSHPPPPRTPQARLTQHHRARSSQPVSASLRRRPRAPPSPIHPPPIHGDPRRRWLPRTERGRGGLEPPGVVGGEVSLAGAVARAGVGVRGARAGGGCGLVLQALAEVAVRAVVRVVARVDW